MRTSVTEPARIPALSARFGSLFSGLADPSSQKSARSPLYESTGYGKSATRSFFEHWLGGWQLRTNMVRKVCAADSPHALPLVRAGAGARFIMTARWGFRCPVNTRLWQVADCRQMATAINVQFAAPPVKPGHGHLRRITTVSPLTGKMAHVHVHDPGNFGRRARLGAPWKNCRKNLHEPHRRPGHEKQGH